MSNKSMMQQAQKLQAQLAKVQQELAEATLEVSSGGGVVKITVDGQQEIKSVKISPEVIDPDDVEMLEDLVLTAINEAIGQSQQLAAKQMGELTGGLKIPGLM
ncbi:YbaB/EbfC family nucleoid-associated protein [Chloroflexota bacterium]